MATFSITLVVHSAPSVSATFIPEACQFDAPVAPGTVVGTVDVDPPEWSGIITVDAPFSMMGNNVVVGPIPLAMGTYMASGVATP